MACHGVIVKMRSRKGRRGRLLYEDKVEMRLGEVEERGGTAASTRQAAHERRGCLKLVDGYRSKKVSNRHKPDECTPFGHPKVQRAMLIHEVGSFC